MPPLLRRAQDHEAGFTLIELLVVILIVGVLAAIAIPLFLNQRKAAVDASLKSDVKQLSLLAETYMTQHPGQNAPVMAVRSETDEDPGSWGSHNAMGLDFKPSDGTSIRMHRSWPSGAAADATSGYVIDAWNPGSTKYTSEDTPLKYVSFKGGFQN